jgi:hypothetical protein
MHNYKLYFMLGISLLTTHLLTASWQDRINQALSFVIGAQIIALPYEVLTSIMYKSDLWKEKKLKHMAEQSSAEEILFLNATDFKELTRLRAVLSQKEFLALCALAAGSIIAFIADSTYKTDSTSAQARLNGIIFMVSVLVVSTLESFTDKPKECSEKEEMIRKIITQLLMVCPVLYFNIDWSSFKALFTSKQTPTILTSSTVPSA